MANDVNIVVAAQVQGALGPLRQVQRQLGQVDQSVNQSTAALRRNAGQYNATSVATNKFAKGALQQAGFQIGDYAVQVANGTSKMQAFGQQGSQLLGIFGPVGAVLGAGVAIFSAFAVAAERSGKSTSTFADAQDALNDIMSTAKTATSILQMDVEELTEKYGEMSDEVVQSAQRLLELSRIQAASALASEIRELDDVIEQFVAQQGIIGFGRVATEAMENIREAFGATSSEAEDLEAAFRELSEASSFQAQKDVLAEIRDIFSTMGVEELPPELARVLVALEQTNITAAELETVLSGNTNQASRFADQVERSARAVRSINTSSLERLSDLQAEIAARTAGATEEQVRVQRAIIAATRAARENGIEGARQLRMIAAEAAQTEQEIIDAENALADLVPTISDAANETSNFAAQMERAAMAVRSINAGAFERLQQLQAEVSARAAGATDEQVRVQRAIIAATAEARERGIEGPRQLRMIAAEAGRIEREIIAAENALVQYAETSGPATSAVRENMRTIPPVVDEIDQRMQGLQRSIEGSMETAFMSMIDGTKSVEDAFRTMAAEIIKELYRVMVVQRLVNSISNAIFGFGSLAPASSPIPIPRPFEGGGYTGAGPRSGGVDGRGGFHAILHPNETVIDHARGQSMGGVVVNQTINVSTGVQQTVRTEIKSMMPQIAESAKNAVVDAKLRGGSYGRAF